MAESPEDSISCYFCNSEGCYCKPGRHSVFKRPAVPQNEQEDCVQCDVCEGTGELSRKSVDVMVAHYHAEDQFKKAWKSAM